MVKNKKGWLRIFEATIAILLIFGAILLIYQGKRTDNDTSYIKDLQGNILSEIAQNNYLRMEIVNDSLEKRNVTQFIRERLPSNWDFNFSICNVTGLCEFQEEYPNTDVFAQERVIAGVLSEDQYSEDWRRIRLFVWKKSS
jgi:uncharacterized membrane protein